MTCIKTGAVLLIKPYSITVRADAYQVGGAYAFRISNGSDEPWDHNSPTDFIINDWEHWFDQHLTYSLMLCDSFSITWEH